MILTKNYHHSWSILELEGWDFCRWRGGRQELEVRNIMRETAISIINITCQIQTNVNNDGAPSDGTSERHFLSNDWWGCIYYLDPSWWQCWLCHNVFRVKTHICPIKVWQEQAGWQCGERERWSETELRPAADTTVSLGSAPAAILPPAVISQNSQVLHTFLLLNKRIHHILCYCQNQKTLYLLSTPPPPQYK